MDDGEISIQSGLARLQSGDATGAVQVLEQLTATEPENGTAFQYLGVARTQAGDMAGGVASLERAAALLPTNAGVWYNLGIALDRAARAAEARSALQRAVALDPNHARAVDALSKLQGAMPVPPPVMPEAPVAVMPGLGTIGGGTAPPPPSVGLRVPPAPLLGQAGASYAPPTGGVYVPEAPAAWAARQPQPPSTGLRILRGIGWGAVCGQWWTLLNAFWFIVWGGFKDYGTGGAIVFLVLSAFAFAFMGSLVGLIEGATDMNVNAGAIVGVVAGLIFAGLDFLLQGMNPSALINVLFWIYSGRRVGAMIALRIQQPVDG